MLLRKYHLILKNVRQHVIKLINIKPAARSCHAIIKDLLGEPDMKEGIIWLGSIKTAPLL